MREVNFSIPNVNKASVHITTTLYDRRALDCTSTLPLINSLNHLAYLTTSSARIRDILTVDGGVERLVCILKEGRRKDEMHMWKWNLAFQCIVNIGVRGSENVRTRLVEADMVPVIASILWNYVLVIEREKAKADAEQARRNAARHTAIYRLPKITRDTAPESATRSSFLEHLTTNAEQRQPRRQAPPPSLDIPQSFTQAFGGGGGAEIHTVEITPTPTAILTSPPERTHFARPHSHRHNISQDTRINLQRSLAVQPPTTAVPMIGTNDGLSIRPVRDIDRLPPMLPPLNTGVGSRPESPTTPVQRSVLSPTGRRMRRPSIRHQISTSGDGEDVVMEEVTAMDVDVMAERNRIELDGRLQQELGNITPTDNVEIEDQDRPRLTIAIPTTEAVDVDNVDIAQQTPVVAGVFVPNLTQPIEPMGTSPIPPLNAGGSPTVPLNGYFNMLAARGSASTGTSALMPRDEDVLMGLQLLAYISKYCYLRHYFQATHLVPRLRIDREVERLYGPAPGCAPMPGPDEDEEEEFLQSDDYNIFPLVEKFTVRHHSKDMQYWACVVMRNLCRKDDARGGIRQCANYQCGKWEEYTRQFAKCRRCRRTKYCSKECQRESWGMHRHWCQTSP